jgi:hypothetical protein
MARLDLRGMFDAASFPVVQYNANQGVFGDREPNHTGKPDSNIGAVIKIE